MRASTFLQRSPLFLLAAVLTALAVFVVGDTPPASAQPTVYVSNLGQTAHTTVYDTLIQGFTTGSESGGYTLGSIDAVVGNAPTTQAQRDTIRVELWSAVAPGETDAGKPNAKLLDLTVPAHPITAGTVSFPAPANTTLAASTKYFVYIRVTGSFALNMATTVSDDEDSGGATGWSIENTTYYVSGGGFIKNATSPDLAGKIAVKAAQSSPLDLSALTAESSTDGTDFSAMSGAEALAPAFDADTTGYRATVGNDVTHVRLTPTLADSGSSVKVGKAGTTLAPVTSGSASAAIALDVGDNAITVEVTDTDSNTRDYTVTVRRVPTGTVWWATFTLGGTGSVFGCDSLSECNSQLSDNSFTVGGQAYAFNALNRQSASVIGTLSADKNAALQALKFCAGSTGFDFPDTASRFLFWDSQGVSWAVGDTVSVSIGTSCVQGTAASTNANLSGLTASSSTSATGTFNALTLTPTTFDADTTSYSATVANNITHVKLTPTVEDSGATVEVGGSPATSGTASAAQPVNVGNTGIFVEVTAEDGVTTKTYLVTITRRAATVSLSASPTTVDEGNSVTVTATLSHAQSGDVTIPIAITDNTAQSGDHGTLASITVSGGATTGTGTISTTQDTTAESDETFTVALGSPLPTGIAAGTPSSVQITIRDDDTTTATVTVSLSASPTTVDEGDPVTITATLTTAQTNSVTIPVTITDNTAQPGDHGALTSITINANAASGTGTITTTQDTTDESDETFTVALGSSLPTGITAGTPSSVQITIRDDDSTTPKPTVSISASPSTVREGSSVTVTATLSQSRTSDTVVPLEMHAGSAESGDYGTLESITIPSGSTTGTGIITTTADTDTDDEAFNVALKAVTSDAVYAWGASTWLDITIHDSGLRRVSLSVSPNPVAEGSEVTVTATLTSARSGELASLGSNVTIPITLTAGSAEGGDYGSLSSITISAGDTSGEGTITTAQDTDADDETFTVALGDLTTVAGVTSGPVTSVQVRINDDETASPGTLSVDTGFGNPTCGSTINVTSETPEWALVLSPAPSADVETEYRVLADVNGNWLAGVPILTTGSSVFTSTNTYGGLLEAYPGFRGFEYRLADHPDVTVSCTWTIQPGGV